MDDVDRLLAYCDSVLDDPADWKTPGGYPNSLALCLIDSIWSLGVQYSGTVLPVLARYRTYRAEQQGDADRDGLTNLLQVYDELGGPDGFASKIGTQHRTSAHRGAPLKAVATYTAAFGFQGLGINTVQDLLGAVDESDVQIRRVWRETPGQRSSDIGWRYLLLLAGVDEVKPDRMICRFVAAALGEPRVSNAHAARLLTEAAHRRGWRVHALDHAVWRYQQRLRTPAQPGVAELSPACNPEAGV
ncbi:heme peroxidase [Micromonospora sonchi]|uniref:Heme peroxidase n=1 Tax=Micromonospora sonchi TaxID=1763543 RepID=A0A917TF93_9ACTN|nr:heme peroxidase [Micromonospora sonchi]GGM21332.1 heme peroxidase [Micromonospora sonchi]